MSREADRPLPTIMTDISISAVVPCFEEADHLESTVHDIASVLDGVMGGRGDGDRQPNDWELVLVVSDAARDGTPEVAARLAQRNPRIRVQLQPANDPGYGRAVALGIAASRFEWLWLVDGDGQFDPRDLPRFVDELPGNDLVTGIRVDRSDSLARRLAGKLYSTVATRVAGVRVRDVDCAFKLVRASLLNDVRFHSRTGAVNAELLSAVARNGGRIRQLPVRHLPRKGGTARFETGRWKLPRVSEVLAIGRDLLALARRRKA